MALLAVASTVQVCHSHDEQAGQGAIASFAFATSHDLAESLHPPGPLPDTTSSVNCPLCVAMHSALPVTQGLATLEIVQVTQRAIAVQTAKRLFLWRFHLASRPPPAAEIFA